MSSIMELIRGIESKIENRPLIDVVEIKNGRDYKKLAAGNIPVYGSGGIIAYVDQYAYDKPSVLIPRKGSLDKLYFVTAPFWNVDTIFYTVIDTTLMEPKFLYYVLASMHLERLNKAGGVPSLTQSVLNKIHVPVPPLEVQQEIVRILDQFTQLTAELTEKLNMELIAREQQYNYYLDELLTFHSDIPKMKLGEIATQIYRGSGIKRDELESTGIPCVRYGEIYTTYNIWFDQCVSHTSEEKIKNPKYFEYGDILFAITGESVEDIAKSCVYTGHERCLAGGDIVVMKHNQDPKYMGYVLSTTAARMQKSKGKIKSKVVHSSVPAISEIVIPVPPLPEQRRIVAILDRFDALCNDLTSGLPAEIAARQKQYEYYRDKLLTFKKREG